MHRRIRCVLFVLALLAVVRIPGYAAVETGSIRVTLKRGQTALTGGELALYRVGEAAEGGYRLEESFGGGFVTMQDALSPALAQWLSEKVTTGGIKRLLDADGSAEFTLLPEGLYLLVQSKPSDGNYVILPFLVAMPYDGEWQIQAYPKVEKVPLDIPETGQSVLPFYGMAGMLFSGAGLLLCGRNRKRS